MTEGSILAEARPIAYACEVDDDDDAEPPKPPPPQMLASVRYDLASRLRPFGRQQRLTMMTNLRLMLLASLLILSLFPRFSHSAITVPSKGHHGKKPVVYESQPAMFGFRFEPTKEYPAHLQFLPEDPFLCGDGGSLVGAEAVLGGSRNGAGWSRSVRGTTGDSMVVVPEDGEPVAILAKRGQCSFEQKARTAMDIDSSPVTFLFSPSTSSSFLRFPGNSKRGRRHHRHQSRLITKGEHIVRYVIVYDDNDHGSTLVPMSANKADDIDIGLLFVSHESGSALVQTVQTQSKTISKWGGTSIILDADAPDGADNSMYDDPAAWMLAALAAVFLFMACFGCVMLCAQSGYIHRDGGVIVIGRRPQEEVSAEAAPLLTQEQVLRLPEVEYVGDGVTAEEVVIKRKRRGNKRRGKKAKSPPCLMSTSSLATAESSSSAASDAVASASASAASTVANGEGPIATPLETPVLHTESVNSNTPNTSCSVCLDEYEPGERLRALPCGHTFHTDCIVPWLTRRQPNCPLCKAVVVSDRHLPTPRVVEESESGSSDDGEGETSSSGGAGAGGIRSDLEQGSEGVWGRTLSGGGGNESISSFLSSRRDRDLLSWTRRWGLWSGDSEGGEGESDILRRPLLRHPRSPRVFSRQNSGAIDGGSEVDGDGALT